MPTPTANLITREDTLLGVCQGLGEDFGFHPNWLRVGLGAVLLFSLPIAIAAYLVLGAALLIARLGSPVPTIAEPAARAVSVAPAADNDQGATLANAA